MAIHTLCDIIYTSVKERRKAMAKNKKKSSKADYKEMLIKALIDLIIGTLLIIIDKLLD